MADESNDLRADLNPAQRRAVFRPDGPALVLAGPGSGKTRVITYRIAYLLQERNADPETILAVTFTRKAAEEMQTRLQELCDDAADAVWIMTFHSFALRLLREHGDAIGLDSRFVVMDEGAQADLITLAMQRCDAGQDVSVGEFRRLQDFISESKVAPAEHIPESEDEYAFYRDVAAAYQDLLSEHRALDFDDLLIQAQRLLYDVEDVRAQVQARFRHVLVDEAHDINPVQYELLRLVAPPDTRAGKQADVMVVADDNQSIYGWRGARPELIERFRREYGAQRIFLEHNYRSMASIVAAAEGILHQGQSYFRRDQRPERGPGEAVAHHFFPDLASEQTWLKETIGQLLHEGYKLGDIAILYRTHYLADPVEQSLRQAGWEVCRVQRDAFFQREGVREIVRHLQLLHAFNDVAFTTAINFPRVLADELTMLQLRALARQDQRGLAEMALDLDSYPEVSPLTRAAVRRFVADVEQELLPALPLGMQNLIDTLFNVLGARRLPYREEEMESLVGFVAFFRFDEEAARLRHALDEGRTIALRALPTTDALAAGLILEHALQQYLHVSPAWLDVGDTVPADAFCIDLGEVQGEAGPGLRLLARDVGSIQYPIALAAWRLAQALLVSYETLDQERFVVYDLETTGVSTDKDEPVEIAAVTYDRGQEVGDPFHSLIRPARRITPGAQAVHGLTMQNLASAPKIEAVLPRFLRYVGNAILAGHNILEFDNIILGRGLRKHLKRHLTNPSLDTLEMARRLLPRQNHSLEALVERFDLADTVVHRALPDVHLEAALLYRLLEETRWRKELGALTELLPLVAVGMLAAGAPLRDENQSLYNAAARVMQAEPMPPWQGRLLDLLDDDAWWQVSRWLAGLTEEVLPLTLDDQRWAELRRLWQRQVDLFVDMGDGSLIDFLDYAALAVHDEEAEASDDEITLMTLHNSKGKEFPVVFILGAEEGNLPIWLARDHPDRIQEERRVLYVGMTRARDRLFITSVRERQEGWQRASTVFLRELAPGLLVRHLHRLQGSKVAECQGNKVTG